MQRFAIRFAESISLLFFFFFDVEFTSVCSGFDFKTFIHWLFYYLSMQTVNFITDILQMHRIQFVSLNFPFILNIFPKKKTFFM